MAVRVEAVASAERRSLANMVEVLLLAALTELEARGLGEVPGAQARKTADTRSETPLVREAAPAGLGTAARVDASRSVSPADVAATIQGVTVVRPHMKKNRPAVECPERVVAGECPLCGTVVI